MARRISLKFALAIPLIVACNSLNGFSGLEKVSDCVGECKPDGGADGGGFDGGGPSPKTVSVGRKTSCLIMDDRSVQCWGANPGVNPGTVATSPVRVPKLKGIDAVTVGLDHSCAVDDVGTVWCWGRNDHGQLGDGTTTPRSEPAVVPNLPTIDTVTVGKTHSCAHTKAEADPVQAFCWGDNGDGQIGDGTRNDSPTPVKLTLGAGAKVVRLGPGAGYTCAIAQVGDVFETWCWGKNDKGQCGQDPTTAPNVPAPAKVAGLPQLERVYPGTEHVCGRTAANKIAWCWGANDHGQVGINTTSPWEIPHEVVGVTPLDTIFAGARHTCLIENSSLDAFCWGANDLGQLGGPPGVDSPLPSRIPALAGDRLSSRQSEHGCQIRGSEVYCWGANDSGQLGVGTTSPFELPSKVSLAP